MWSWYLLDTLNTYYSLVDALGESWTLNYWYMGGIVRAERFDNDIVS